MRIFLVLFVALAISYGEGKILSGYWENWKGALVSGGGGPNDPSYYKPSVASFSHVFYSFLTLDKSPNPDQPGKEYWNGKAIYESMTWDDVVTVMTKTDPEWENPDEWQRKKVAALIEAVHDNGSKFIWAIGGWSDLTKTLRDGQIDAFVAKCVELLTLEGDGIDFDWEHLSEDSSIATEQRKTIAKTMLALRQALDAAGMQKKRIGYTTRFNAFWNDETRPQGYTAFPTDGEGITIEQTLNEMGSSLNQIVDWANIMLYDVPPSDLAAPDGFTLRNYKEVFDAFSKRVDKDKIIMGFEPGGQAAGGKWEGMQVDREVIDFIQTNNYGGVMFWAINQPPWNSQEITGNNVQELAKYAVAAFHDGTQATPSPTTASPGIPPAGQSTAAPTTAPQPITTPAVPNTTSASGSGKRVCKPTAPYTSVPGMTEWCNVSCNHINPYCPSSHCICDN